MAQKLDKLARELENVSLKSDKSRILNREVLHCVDKWLDQNVIEKWVGFTRLGFPEGKKYPAKWRRPEILLDVIAFKLEASSTPIFGSELEWSRRRTEDSKKNANEFIRRLGLRNIVGKNQGATERAYDLCRLLAVRPESMLFLSRGGTKPDRTLENLKDLAKTVSKTSHQPLHHNLLLGVIEKRATGDYGFITGLL